MLITCTSRQPINNAYFKNTIDNTITKIERYIGTYTYIW